MRLGSTGYEFSHKIYEEEDSKMAARGRKPPKVKSWSDTGDTPYRQNH
jgi:hypothetical protein